MKIAFDVDDTLIIPSIALNIDGGRDTPNYETINLYKWFQDQGHEMFVWSGSGIDWATAWVEKLGLAPCRVIQKEKRLTLDTDDGQPAPYIDIAFDDCDVDLAKMNVKVKRINNDISRADWNKTKRI